MISAEYSAGFFDGEGSVYAASRNSPMHKRPSPTVIVCISNTNEKVLLLHKEKWGGSISKRKHREGWQDQYQWVLAARMAYPFLEAIFPHLVIKRDVVSAAIQICKLMQLPAKERIDYSNSIQSGNRRRVSPQVKTEFSEKVSVLHNQIRALNTRGAPYNATREYHAT